MYIDPFVAGVLTTIFVEVVLLVGIAIFSDNNKKK